MLDEWMVYSWEDGYDKNRVGLCQVSTWETERSKPHRRDELELIKCEMLVRGLTQEEAERFVALTKEPK
jgi:hypothetical protein